MNEDFVTYEIALKLEEKGFNEPCYGYYRRDGGDDSFEVCGNGTCDFLNSKNKHRIAAPTISQVLKWLRDEKKIVVIIFPHSCGWQADIYKDVHQYYDSEAERYLMYYYKEKTEISHSYNWLEIYCIQYVLNYLIYL